MSPPQASDKEIEASVDVSNAIIDCKTMEATMDVANDLPKLETNDVNVDMTTDLSDCEKVESNVNVHDELPENQQCKADLDKTNDISSTKITENITSSLATLTTEDSKVNIATLVFFDLETTGLAKTVGKKNVQITEVSMIAVGRKEFCKCSYPDLRDVRVVQKLSLCIRPRCSMSREASCITGLTNANLQDQGQFDENTATLITAFLSHLKKPVCILAHNGKLFDFPILKSEFEKLSTPLPSDVYIVDTLIGFRKFGMPELPMNQKLHKDVKFKLNGNISYALQNLHLYFFGKQHVASHSSEGDCIALAKVCHKVRERIIPWIDENCFKFDAIVSMW